MAIRAKNLALDTSMMQRVAGVSLGNLATGVTTVGVFRAPHACEVLSITVHGQNGFSANASNTLEIRAYKAGASGSTDLTLQVMAINTSAATNAYTANAPLTLTPSANASMTQGTLLMLQFSANCQAVLSGTFVSVIYKPLLHKESR